MGASCKNLAWIADRRRIHLESALEPHWDRRRFGVLAGAPLSIAAIGKAKESWRSSASVTAIASKAGDRPSRAKTALPLARKWRRNPLKSLDSRPEMVWLRKLRATRYRGAAALVSSGRPSPGTCRGRTGGLADRRAAIFHGPPRRARAPAAQGGCNGLEMLPQRLEIAHSAPGNGAGASRAERRPIGQAPAASGSPSRALGVTGFGAQATEMLHALADSPNGQSQPFSIYRRGGP